MEVRTFLSAAPIVYSYVTEQNTYNVTPGQVLTVNIYLQETLNGNISLIDGNGENGLFGAGFEVMSGTRPTDPSTITGVNFDATDFKGPFHTSIDSSQISNPNDADVLEAISTAAAVGVPLANGNGAAADEVYLGNLTITAGSATGTTTFLLGEYDVQGKSGGNTITNPDSYDLDDSSNSPTPYTGAGTTTTTFSVDVSPSGLPTPSVAVTSGNTTYNGNAYTPAATVGGTSGTDSSAALTYTYYAGSGTSGANLGSSAPANAGIYTVVAHFAGDSTYAAADSPPKAFTIAPAKPALMINAGSSASSGDPFPVTVTVAGVASGVDSTLAASLEGVSPTIAYYAGSAATGSPLGSVPTAPGVYTVVANFPGSENYATSTTSVTLSLDEPPMISAQSFVINSKALVGAVVGTVAATDPDGHTLTYTLSADPTAGAIDYGKVFQINNNGVVTVTSPAKLLTITAGQTKTATFEVTVTDNTTLALSTSAIITVTLNPMTPMPPIFSNTKQTPAMFNETDRKNVRLGSLTASPAYKGQKFTYSLTGADAALFAISAHGVITTRSALDYFHTPTHTYSFTVVATDSRSAGERSATIPVMLKVTDIAPTIKDADVHYVVLNNRAVAPFRRVVIADVIPTHIDTLIITLHSTSTGAFTPASLAAIPGITWEVDTATNTYTIDGTAASLTKAIAQLVFQPVPPALGLSETTTTFAIAVTNGAATATVDATVINKAKS